MATNTPPPHRSWRAHGAAVLALVTAAAGGFAINVFGILSLYPLCEADFSEDTVVAPKSYRGQLLCSIDKTGNITDREAVVFVLMGLSALLVIFGLISWIRKRRAKSVALLIAAALVVPALSWLLMASIPADCTEDQQSEYGDRGCERDEELRPGLNWY